MPEATVRRATRGVSPILLVLAALCFLLPFAGVSCNTAAGSAALNAALSQSGGSKADTRDAAACLQALNGKDLVTYSGVDLATGGSPSTSTSIPGCPSSTSASPRSSAGPGAIGVQPLVVLAFILILAGIATAVLRAPLRALAGAAAALLAGVLVLVDNFTVHGTILDKITAGAGSPSSVGLSGTASSFFDVHAGLGVVLVLIALFLAVVVNAVALVPPPLLAGTTPPGAAPPPGGDDPPWSASAPSPDTTLGAPPGGPPQPPG